VKTHSWLNRRQFEHRPSGDESNPEHRIYIMNLVPNTINIIKNESYLPSTTVSTSNSCPLARGWLLMEHWLLNSIMVHMCWLAHWVINMIRLLCLRMQRHVGWNNRSSFRIVVRHHLSNMRQISISEKQTSAGKS